MLLNSFLWVYTQYNATSTFTIAYQNHCRKNRLDSRTAAWSPGSERCRFLAGLPPSILYPHCTHNEAYIDTGCRVSRCRHGHAARVVFEGMRMAVPSVIDFRPLQL